MNDESAWEDVKALREQVIRLAKANDEMARLNLDLMALVAWTRHSIHVTHHEGELETCQRQTCVALQGALDGGSRPDFTNRIQKENTAE